MPRVTRTWLIRGTALAGLAGAWVGSAGTADAFDCRIHSGKERASVLPGTCFGYFITNWQPFTYACPGCAPPAAVFPGPEDYLWDPSMAPGQPPGRPVLPMPAPGNGREVLPQPQVQPAPVGQFVPSTPISLDPALFPSKPR
jgi:hypothetical protein